jgi:hypothetical protein
VDPLLHSRERGYGFEAVRVLGLIAILKDSI